MLSHVGCRIAEILSTSFIFDVSDSLATFFSPFLQPVMKWPVILGSQLDRSWSWLLGNMTGHKNMTAVKYDHLNWCVLTLGTSYI